MDCFCGSGTTAIAARNTGRHFLCCDLSPEYVKLANERLRNTDPYEHSVFADGSKQLSMFAGMDK